MSYPGLVGHTDHAQASGEKLFDEIIFFVIQCRAAEMTYARRVIDDRVRLFVHKRALARFPHAVGTMSMRAIERISVHSFDAARDISFLFRVANA
jgi:hypothetical protein